MGMHLGLKIITLGFDLISYLCYLLSSLLSASFILLALQLSENLFEIVIIEVSAIPEKIQRNKHFGVYSLLLLSHA